MRQPRQTDSGAMSEAIPCPPGDQPPPEPTLKWHICPVCGLAGWAREGFGYCRIHGEQDPDETLPRSPPTAIEVVLGRQILKDPPSLRDWIKRFGGYSKITAEGWAEYHAAMAEWRDEAKGG